MNIDLSFKRFFQGNDIKLSLILGSGLELDDKFVTNKQVIHEDNSGVHTKQIYLCYIGREKVLVFKGRKHFYEGYGINEITSNISLMRESGCRNLLVTNAAGGVNENYNVGDMMLISSWLNLNYRLKLLRKSSGNIQNNLDNELTSAFRKCNIKLHRGVYAYLPGPSYETRAEITFLKKYFADAVGMSTVPEMSLARYYGIKTTGLSIITNLLKRNVSYSANHNDVLHVARTVSSKLPALVNTLLSELK
ncbi:MAG: purine-nucleoside phosphorylase [Ignavibacteria bacterium]|nr:purine-nucleoside phosphorylase [Ignavibacteria bacterium]